MSPPLDISRSPQLMSADDTALLVVDVQEKLLRVIPNAPRLVWNIRRLLDGAQVLAVPAVATEQYPEGLGPSAAELAQRLVNVRPKLAFSCAACGDLFADLRSRGIDKLLVAGIETHVCVQQTVLDLLARGWRVYVALDAIGSRFDLDLQAALRRMESSGAVLTTTESVLFEWCEAAGSPQFKHISQIVREATPD